MRIHHIAYACVDVEVAAPSFELLGYKRESAPVDDEFRHVRISFMSNSYGERIELVAPLDDKSPVVAYLDAQHDVSQPYHICYEVDDIEATRRKLIAQGFVPTSTVNPAPAISGRDVCFLFNRGAGLIELVATERAT